MLDNSDLSVDLPAALHAHSPPPAAQCSPSGGGLSSAPLPIQTEQLETYQFARKRLHILWSSFFLREMGVTMPTSKGYCEKQMS